MYHLKLLNAHIGTVVRVVAEEEDVIQTYIYICFIFSIWVGDYCFNNVAKLTRGGGV